MSESHRWFRMYSEFSSDPKVQSMDEAMQRRLVMLFCLRCGNVLATLHDDELMFALRIDETEFEKTKALFLKKGFIDEQWNIRNWNKRQFVSDNSTERSRRHRAKKRGIETNETAMQQPCNVAETPSDTETDIETEIKEKKNKKEKFDAKSALLTLGVSEQTADDWLSHRKSKRLSSTRTVLDQHHTEAIKAGTSLDTALQIACARGWQGVKADWLVDHLAKNPRASPQGHQSQKQDWIAELTGGNRFNENNIIDIT